MLSDQLKQAIIDSGKTMMEIAGETGVTHPVLSCFLSNDPETHRDIRLETTADKLAAYFGLELGPADKPKTKSKSPAVDWTKADLKEVRNDRGRKRRK